MKGTARTFSLIEVSQLSIFKYLSKDKEKYIIVIAFIHSLFLVFFSGYKATLPLSPDYQIMLFHLWLDGKSIRKIIGFYVLQLKNSSRGARRTAEIERECCVGGGEVIETRLLACFSHC